MCVRGHVCVCVDTVWAGESQIYFGTGERQRWAYNYSQWVTGSLMEAMMDPEGWLKQTYEENTRTQNNNFHWHTYTNIWVHNQIQTRRRTTRVQTNLKSLFPDCPVGYLKWNLRRRMVVPSRFAGNLNLLFLFCQASWDWESCFHSVFGFANLYSHVCTNTEQVVKRDVCAVPTTDETVGVMLLLFQENINCLFWENKIECFFITKKYLPYLVLVLSRVVEKLHLRWWLWTVVHL